MELTEFEPFCSAAGTFWRCNTLPPADPVILVDAMGQDLRVTMRNLATANALRRIVPARLVALTSGDSAGTAPELVDAVLRAYGAAEVLDVDDLAGRLTAAVPPAGFTVAGHTFAVAGSGTDPAVFETVVSATAARTGRSGELRRRSQAFAEIYESLYAGLQTVALVTGMVDYDRWGLAVDAARRAGVPVLHVQSTGTLRVHGYFGEPGYPVRADNTRRTTEFFDTYVWPRRAELHQSAELVAWRNKRNLGRPAWWRGGGAISMVELSSAAEREALRRHALDRFGFDAAKPVVAVYNQLPNDAPGTNVEAFADPAEWLVQTAELAARRDDANWLFLDHPASGHFGTSEQFDAVAARHAGQRHLAFARSLDLSKNVIWSLADLGVTVRGSVGAELPAYGIGVVQAGWSEWSGLGFDAVAHDPDHYRLLLEDSLAALKAGRPLLSAEQVEKARLWMWFYRSATDVPSVFVQHWDLGVSDVLFKTLRTSMDHVEADADPLFTAVRRLWERRDPVLTRFDLTRAEEVPS